MATAGMSKPGSHTDEYKRRAAAEAAKLIEPRMTVGLGSGSTAAHFIALVGARVREGLSVAAVATSEDSRRLAEAAGIEVVEADETTRIDLAVDGTDEVDAMGRLIKGGGGALLREKIVAAAAARFVVIADASKRVAQLGRFPLPVEIDCFAYGLTTRRVREALAALGHDAQPRLRIGGDRHAFVSDGGNYVIDCALGRIGDPAAVDGALKALPGVIETGLFIGLADMAIFAGPDGVDALRFDRP
jgi:ribose 5-phosphate isomerase A